jgi:hypothetical protein
MRRSTVHNAPNEQLKLQQSSQTSRFKVLFWRAVHPALGVNFSDARDNRTDHQQYAKRLDNKK